MLHALVNFFVILHLKSGISNSQRYPLNFQFFLCIINPKSTLKTQLQLLILSHSPWIRDKGVRVTLWIEHTTFKMKAQFGYSKKKWTKIALYFLPVPMCKGHLKCTQKFVYNVKMDFYLVTVYFYSPEL